LTSASTISKVSPEVFPFSQSSFRDVLHRVRVRERIDSLKARSFV